MAVPGPSSENSGHDNGSAVDDSLGYDDSLECAGSSSLEGVGHSSNSSNERPREPEPRASFEVEDSTKEHGQQLIKRHEPTSGLVLFLRFLLTSLDVITDCTQAALLVDLGFPAFAALVVAIDFLPGVFAFAHYFTSRRKKDYYAVLAFASLLAHPLIVPVSCAVLWRARKWARDSEKVAALRYAADLSKYLMGSLESPLQLVLIAYLVWTDRLYPPWRANFTYADYYGNEYNLRNAVTVASFAFSFLALTKAGLDNVDALGWPVHKRVLRAVSWSVYVLLTSVFRMVAFVLLLTYLHLWCAAVVLSVLLCNWLVVYCHAGDEAVGVFPRALAVFASVFIPAFFVCKDIDMHRSLVGRIHMTTTAATNTVLGVALVATYFLLRQSWWVHQSDLFGNDRRHVGAVFAAAAALFAVSTLSAFALISEDVELNLDLARIGSGRLIELKRRLFYAAFAVGNILLVAGACAAIALPLHFNAGGKSENVLLLFSGSAESKLSITAITSNSSCVLPLELDQERLHAVAGAVDNTLYVCGGRRGWSRLRSCLTLKKGQTEWGRDTNLSESRVAATSAVVGGKLYVAGGATSDRDISAFDPRTGRWSRVADLGRASGCAVGLHSGIVFVGGQDRNYKKYYDVEYVRVRFGADGDLGSTNASQSVVRKKLPDLNFARAEHGCALTEIKSRPGIVVVGGRGVGKNGGKELRSVEFLAILSEPDFAAEWKVLEPLNYVRVYFPAVGHVGVDNKLIVTSGYSYGGTTVIEEWDDEKGIWMKRPDTLVRGGQRHAYLSVDISFVAAVGGECIAKS